MNKLLIVCGSTATGKTSLALKLAKKINGEIISVDSRQVYRYLDIITGKDLPEDSKSSWQKSEIEVGNKDLQIGSYQVDSTKIWLYDLIDPKYSFNVSDWLDCAQAVADDIWQRGKIPILVGGTGFYLQAFLKGIGTLNIPPDWKLRDKLETFSVSKLADLLKKTDSKKWLAMNNSDQHNPRRLIRAIEVAYWLKKDKENNLVKTAKKLEEKSSLFLTLAVVLDADYPFLYKRIDSRVEQRVKNGAEKEINSLLGKGYDFNNSVLDKTIGYSEWQDYFQDKNTSNKEKVDKEEIIQRWKYDEHAYARRQKNWFKKTFPQNSKNKWFDISQKDWENKVEKKIIIWYNKNKDAKKN